MPTVSTIINGVTYSLDDGTYCYFVDHDGLGMLPIHRLSSRGPMQHGDTDRGYRADPRVFRLVLYIDADNQLDWFTKRETLMSIFSPDRLISIRFVVGTYTRQIDCYYLGDMSMSGADKVGSYGQKVSVTLRAPDPTFYDPIAANAETFPLSLGMSVPTAVPTALDGATINEARTIAYTGNWRDYPIVRITGPITNPVLTNLTTNEKLDFTGITISAGDYYLIDCRYGYKTVVNAAGTSKIADLTTDSDLATFHLASTLESPGGINDMKITGSAITNAAAVNVTYNNRYLGL